MNTDKKYYFYAIGTFILFVLVGGGIIWYFNNTSTINPNNTEIISVVKQFVEKNANIGLDEFSKEKFDNRIKTLQDDRKFACEKALVFVDEQSKDFTCRGNFDNTKGMSTYVGSLPTFKLKDVSITDVKQDGSKATVTMDMVVRDVVHFLDADETVTDPNLKKFTKQEILQKIENGEIPKETIINVQRVTSKGKDVNIKGVKLTLKKINDSWKISSSENANTKVAQYFATWNGLSQILNEGQYEKNTPSKILE